MKSRSFSESNYKAMFVGGKTFRFAINPDKPISPLEYPEFSDVKITSFCMGRCPYCFIAGTPVETINGEMPIEDIKIGETVFSFDQKRYYPNTNKVSQKFERFYNGELIVIELENGEAIKCTPNHKFFTMSGKWKRADELNEEDELYNI